MSMRRLVGTLAVFTILTVPGGSISAAQTPPSAFSPGPFVDKAAEKSHIQQEQDRRKWSACKKQARAQKIRLRHWNKFMTACMGK